MQKKKGITISMLAILVVITVIITSTIIVSVKNVKDNANIRIFATELAIVSDEIKQIQKKGTQLNYIQDAIQIDLSKVSEDILLKQFKDEDIVNNTLIVYKIDLGTIGLNNTNYGKQKTSKDVFVLSKKTGKVYYLDGVKAKGTTYYTFTDDLKYIAEVNYKIENPNSQVIFKPSEILWTSNYIKTEVIIPLEFTNISITTNLSGENSENVSSIEEKNGKYIATVNILEKKSNYTITVNYIKDAENKIETFEVKNYDGTAPVISTGELQYKVSANKTETFLPNINVLDNESGIKLVKYEKDKISLESAKEYFEKRGETLNGDKIVIDNTALYYTIFAIDKAGNYTVINVYNPRVVANEADLISALSEGNADVKLIGDINCSSPLVINTLNNTIDLNGHNLTYTNNTGSFTFITIEENASLNIKDTSSEQDGKVLAQLLEESYNGNPEDRYNTIYTINNKGTLTIESGEVTSNLVQLPGEVDYNIHSKCLAKTITNTGTINLNGGNITSYIDSQGVSDSATRNGEATAVGIENAGIVNLNSGSITAEAHARMERASIIYGETRAYAYGVQNSSTGTVNRSENVSITVIADAHSHDTYTTKKDSAEIKQN